jgi:hypothetical protein
MDKGCCSNMQDLFRIAHYLAHNDHYEVAGLEFVFEFWNCWLIKAVQEW